MTSYEHAMIGIDGTLAVGLHRRYGWRIVAFAGLAAVLPDWDGLTLLLGSQCYALGHRVWGHNLLVAGLMGVAVAAVVWRWDLLGRVQKTLAARWALFRVDAAAPNRSRTEELLVWIAVGVVAATSHLAADYLYSSGAGLSAWELPLLWPFSRALFAHPMVPWGDVGTTIILVVGMFAMVYRPRRCQAIAVVTLVLVIGYVVVRGTCF